MVCLGHANRHHEGYARQVDRDLMTRHWYGPEEPHQNPDDTEDSELEKELNPDGNPEPAHPEERLDIERVGPERPHIGSNKRPGDPQ